MTIGEMRCCLVVPAINEEPIPVPRDEEKPRTQLCADEIADIRLVGDQESGEFCRPKQCFW